MTDRILSVLWNSVPQAVTNHLWQSTLVALAAGLLTLALHHPPATAWPNESHNGPVQVLVIDRAAFPAGIL
jgi:hypothetical protein